MRLAGNFKDLIHSFLARKPGLSALLIYFLLKPPGTVNTPVWPWLCGIHYNPIDYRKDVFGCPYYVATFPVFPAKIYGIHSRLVFFSRERKIGESEDLLRVNPFPEIETS
jgi:hypothetical protein